VTTKPFASCAVASISSCYYGSHALEAQGQGPQRNAVQFADRRRAPHRQPGGKQASHPFLSVVCTCTVRSFSFLRRGKIIPAITLAGFVFFFNCKKGFLTVIDERIDGALYFCFSAQKYIIFVIAS